MIEAEGAEIARLAQRHGAQFIVGADPISLGVLKAPGDYGADLVVGPTQTLGVHMNAGGGVGGYIASRDEERYIREYNGFLISITGTAVPGQFGFGLCSSHQTSYGMREDGKDWTGNSVYLWAIANAVYLALLGPEGMREVGAAILQRGAYAARRLGEIEGVRIPFAQGCFKEFVVDFTATGSTVAEINRALRSHGIFGGKDLSARVSRLGPIALYCVTELHSRSRHRPAGRRHRGGRVMSGDRVRKFHAAAWDEPLVMQMGAPGRRGMFFPAVEPEIAGRGHAPTA